jgi:hypothetical protein
MTGRHTEADSNRGSDENNYECDDYTMPRFDLHLHFLLLPFFSD